MSCVVYRVLFSIRCQDGGAQKTIGDGEEGDSSGSGSDSEDERCVGCTCTGLGYLDLPILLVICSSSLSAVGLIIFAMRDKPELCRKAFGGMRMVVETDLLFFHPYRKHAERSCPQPPLVPRGSTAVTPPILVALAI